MTFQRLRLVIFQDEPGLWLARGLEHDLAAEGSTISQAIRSVARLVQAHSEFDLRHDHAPLSAFPPAAQTYWNAYATGREVPLEPLGIVPPDGWEIQAAFAARLPGERQYRAPRVAHGRTGTASS